MNHLLALLVVSLGGLGSSGSSSSLHNQQGNRFRLELRIFIMCQFFLSELLQVHVQLHLLNF
jgi:hypothetical protein